MESFGHSQEKQTHTSTKLELEEKRESLCKRKGMSVENYLDEHYGFVIV